VAIDEFDLSGDTSGTYSVNNDQVTDSFSLAQPSAYGTDAGLSPGAISSIGSGSNPSEDFSDFATQSRSNIAGSDNYSPTFAALDKISRGLDPRGIAGFNNTSFAKTNVGGDMVTAPNPLQQLDQTQVSRITDALKLSGASDTYKYVSQLKGDDLKNYASGLSLKNLSLNDLDNMDTQSMANVFSSLGITDKNPYGISAQGTSTGVLGGISSLLGLDKTPDFSRKGTPTYMSPKDIAEKARAGFGFASSGRNPSEFGSLGGIANQFGRDVSAGAKQIQNDLIQLADGAMSYLSNKGKAGDTVENIVAEQKRIEIADLEEERQRSLSLQGPPQFNEFSRVPARTVTRDGLGVESVFGQLDYPGSEYDKDFNKTVVAGTNLSPNQFRDSRSTNVLDNSFMDSGASLASGTSVPVIERPFVNLPPDPVLVNQIQRDIAKSRGIFDLPEAKPFSESINNQEIAAGTKKGSTLSDREQEDTANYADYLKRVGKAKNEYELYDKAMGYLFANRQKDLPKEVQSKQQANLYPKDIVYLNQLAEDESVAREVYNNLLDLGPKRDFTSPNVNIIPDFFNKDGFTLENKYYNNIFTPKQVEEMRNKGYSLQGIDQLRRPQQFPDKKTVSFSDLSDRNKEQYFLNTNLDYGAPIKTPYNVVY